MSLTEPSGLGAAPMGEQWVCGKGGKGKGPEVWPPETILLRLLRSPAGHCSEQTTNFVAWR
jgi:hypothetical protein